MEPDASVATPVPAPAVKSNNGLAPAWAPLWTYSILACIVLFFAARVITFTDDWEDIKEDTETVFMATAALLIVPLLGLVALFERTLSAGARAALLILSTFFSIGSSLLRF